MSAPVSPNASQGAGPRVFVCPGVYGDDRRLARFRAFCAPLLDMVLLDLPVTHFT